MDAITLSIFSNRIDAVCEEMGVTLQKTAFSPNIRDRLDYSCAVFDAQGELCAQAAHIPVHLGSMAYAMRDIVMEIEWSEGDIVLLNDPYKGGTHLPDVTLIMPVFIDGKMQGYVVNRAHHADIGSETPGSMPLASNLQEEGLIIPPTFLIKQGELVEHQMGEIMATMRNPSVSQGDFNAQIAANYIGHSRLTELINKMGESEYQTALLALNDYAAQLALSIFKNIPDGTYSFDDVLDDDGLGQKNITIKAKIHASAGNLNVNFEGSSKQVGGNVNCPLSVTAAAVYYVFRCLLPAQAPACAGSFRSITLDAPKGSLVNALYPSAVAAGNVETSMRIVDVVLGALAKALPEKIPAASHGTMNNLAMGSTTDNWDYYETIGGGMGASALSDGLDAVQIHMTNTLNTPIESLEMNYPLRINKYAVRENSGGAGEQTGGNGIVREYEFLQDAEFTLLTERRTHSPWGLKLGARDDAYMEVGGTIPRKESVESSLEQRPRATHGAVAEGLGARKGLNALNDELLGGKVSCHVKAGDVLRIETPGGGGYSNQ